jgi:uncharacterized membrane protein YhaH (DUF805 family)
MGFVIASLVLAFVLLGVASARRLKDLDEDPSMAIFLALPFFGWLAVFTHYDLQKKEGTPGPNRYGPEPEKPRPRP